MRVIDSDIGRLITRVSPFVYVVDELKQKDVSKPPIEWVRLGRPF
jgi:hypothetical protein